MVKVVTRCTEFDPANRFQTVDEIQRYIRKTKRNKIVGIVSLIFVICAWIIGGVQFIPTTVNEERRISSQYEIITTIPEQEDNKVFPSFPKTESSSNEISTEVSVKENSQTSPAVQEEHLNNLIYEPCNSRIVDTSDVGDIVPCLQLWEDGSYKTKINLGEGVPEALIEVVALEGKYTLTINKADSFRIENIHTTSSYDYPDGSLFAEIIFYDVNSDGILEILPILCDAHAVPYPKDANVSLLKNYSLGWCIFYDGEQYQLAEGEMMSRYDPFRIYATCPGTLQADFPGYYKLDEGKIIFVE